MKFLMLVMKTCNFFIDHAIECSRMFSLPALKTSQVQFFL